MSVEFNEENKFNETYKSAESSKSGLSDWLVKIGAAKDEKKANNLMIVVAVICFILALYFIIK